MKKNKFSVLTLQLFIRIAAVDLICFLLSFFVFAAVSDQWLRALLQAGCILATVAMIYSLPREAGSVDRGLYSTGQYKRHLFKGFFAGLLAELPLLISGVLLVFSKFGWITEKFIGYYKLIHSIYFPLNLSILPVDETIFSLTWGAVLLSLSMLLVIPLVAMFAYMLGFYRFYFKEALLYKKVGD